MTLPQNGPLPEVLSPDKSSIWNSDNSRMCVRGISCLSLQLPSPNSVGAWFTNSPTSGHPEWDSSCFPGCWSSSWIAFNGSPRIEAAATAAISSLGRQVSVILVVISGYASSMATNVSESSGKSYEKERHPTIQPSNHPTIHPNICQESSVLVAGHRFDQYPQSLGNISRPWMHWWPLVTTWIRKNLSPSRCCVKLLASK